MYTYNQLQSSLPCLCPAAALPLCGAAGRPLAAAGAGALRGSLQLHQGRLPQVVRRHGVGYGRGGGQHHAGAAAAGTLERHGLGLLHR